MTMNEKPNPIREIANTPENFQKLLILVNEYSRSLGACSQIFKALDKHEQDNPGIIPWGLNHAVKEYAQEYELMGAYKEKLLELNPHSNLEH